MKKIKSFLKEDKAIHLHFNYILFIYLLIYFLFLLSCQSLSFKKMFCSFMTNHFLSNFHFRYILRNNQKKYNSLIQQIFTCTYRLSLRIQSQPFLIWLAGWLPIAGYIKDSASRSDWRKSINEFERSLQKGLK